MYTLFQSLTDPLPKTVSVSNFVMTPSNVTSPDSSFIISSSTVSFVLQWIPRFKASHPPQNSLIHLSPFLWVFHQPPFIHYIYSPRPEYEGDQNSDQFNQEDSGHAQGILEWKIYI